MANLTKIFFYYRTPDSSLYGVSPSGDKLRFHIFHGELAGPGETPVELGYVDVDYDTDLIKDGLWRTLEIPVEIDLPVFSNNRYRFIIEVEPIPNGSLETFEEPSEFDTLHGAFIGGQDQSGYKKYFRYTDLDAGYYGLEVGEPGYLSSGLVMTDAKYALAALVDGQLRGPNTIFVEAPPGSDLGQIFWTLLRAKWTNDPYPDNIDMTRARQRRSIGVQFLNIPAPPQPQPINPTPPDYVEPQPETTTHFEWDCTGTPEYYEIRVEAWDSSWNTIYDSGVQNTGTNKFFDLPPGSLVGAFDVGWSVTAVYENGYRATSNWGFAVSASDHTLPYDPSPANKADNVRPLLDMLSWKSADEMYDQKFVWWDGQFWREVGFTNVVESDGRCYVNIKSLLQDPPVYFLRADWPLYRDHTFKWRVDTQFEEGGEFVEGDVWEFTTKDFEQATNIFPANDATSVPIDIGYVSATIPADAIKVQFDVASRFTDSTDFRLGEITITDEMRIDDYITVALLTTSWDMPLNRSWPQLGYTGTHGNRQGLIVRCLYNSP